MAGRARLYFRNKVTSGALLFQWTLPCNSTMLQWLAHWNLITINSQNFVVTKRSHISADYDVILYSADPYALQTTDIICTGNNFEFAKDDVVEFAYTNTSNRTVAVEVVFREAD